MWPRRTDNLGVGSSQGPLKSGTSACEMVEGIMTRQYARCVFRDQQGMALVTVMVVMVVMAVVGIAALTVTGLENRMAGFQRTGEAAATAAESCVGTGVNIIQQTIDQGKVPDAFTTLNNGPVLNQAILEGEIMGQSDNNPDDPSTDLTANTKQTVGASTV